MKKRHVAAAFLVGLVLGFLIPNRDPVQLPAPVKVVTPVKVVRHHHHTIILPAGPFYPV